MNLFDDMPDIPKCPHCGHYGDGLQWAFPDNPPSGFGSMVACACLSCGSHGPEKGDYDSAIKAFAAGEIGPHDDMNEITVRQR